MRAWRLTVAQNPKISSFEKCDFRPIWEKFEHDREKKKQMTKDEKLVRGFVCVWLCVR